MQTHWDLVIIGAGPAGMSAAIEATKRELSVLVLDRQAEAGGQIFRNAGSASLEKRKALGKDYARGYELVQNFIKSSASFLGRATVWHLASGKVYFSHQGQSHCVFAKDILIATGGMERPVPVEGWTEAGVMGVGAADILLKSASLLPKGAVVLCGNGPLILQAVVHLKHFHIPIAGVVLTGELSNPLRAMPRVFGAFARPKYMAHGMLMGLGMIAGAPCYLASKDVRIAKHGEEFSVSFTSMGKARKLNCGTVLLHEGVISESRITRLARLRHTWNADQRYWHVASDVWGNTNIQGIRCAGDVAGVLGADAAMTLGKLAALDVCREQGLLLLQKRDRLAKKMLWDLRRFKAMQPFMDRVFAPNQEILLPKDEAIVCRCEELSAKELRLAVMEGSYSPDGLKAQARPGMGTCQGRMCSAAVAEMIAHTHNIPLEQLNSYHAQLPLSPLLLGELAEMEMQSEGV